MSPAENLSPPPSDDSSSYHCESTISDFAKGLITSKVVPDHLVNRKLVITGACIITLLTGGSTRSYALLPQDQSPQIELKNNPANNLLTASWRADLGKTYFLQTSEDLIHWTYSPNIVSGLNQINRQVIDPEGAKQFYFRLQYTDATPENPDLADYDNDGVPNIVEIQYGSDPFSAASTGDSGPDPRSEKNLVKMNIAVLADQLLSNGQDLTGTSGSTAKVFISGTGKGEISGGVITWSGGNPGSLRGLISSPAPSVAGRAAIGTFMTAGTGDLATIVGFSPVPNSLVGLDRTDGIGLTAQRSSNNNNNRILTNAGSSFQWVEMTHAITVNTPLRMMVRKEADGFSSWIQGGIFSDMGAKVNSATWFPISRWKGVNPPVEISAGIQNAYSGPTTNTEFSDSTNPAINSTSALLDYERNKIGLHVPSLLKLPGGKVAAVWQNANSHETPDCVIKIACRDSRGVWSPNFEILGAGQDGTSNNGPTLHQAGNKIWLTYQSLTDNIFTARKREVTFDNGAPSLSEPVTLFESGLVLNHMLTLPSGRIIASWHTQSSVWKNRISYSDDGGETWVGANFPEFTNRAGEGFAAIEADGTMSSYWRTDRGAIYRSTSLDNGENWSILAPTAIPCPNMPSQGLIGSRIAGYKRPSDGKLVIVGSNSTTQREKLTAWLVENGEIIGTQSLLPWDVSDGSAEGVHYPDLIVHPDDSMTIIIARWLGGGYGSAERHSAINTFQVPAAFQTL